LDFFEEQERARRRSRWLVLACLAAVLFVVASYCAVGAALYALSTAYLHGNAAWPPFEFLAGIAAEYWGAPNALLIGSGLCFLMIFGICIAIPQLWRYRS